MSEQKQPLGKYSCSISLVLIAAGLAMLWAGLTHAGSEEQFQDFIAGAFAFGFGVASLAVVQGWFDTSRSLSKPLYFGMAAVIAVFIGALIECYGMRQIGGYGTAITSDLAWRTHCGQIPYKDLLCPWPVFSILIEELGFYWFGVSWNAIVSMTALFAVVAFVWSVFLLAELLGRTWYALLVAATVQISINGVIAFLWHNNITLTADILFILSAELLFRRSRSPIAIASYFLSLVLVAGVKPNTAGLFIIVFSIFLFLKTQRRALLVGLSIGAYGVFSLIVHLNGISQALLIKNYLTVSGRCTPFVHTWEVLGWVERDCLIVSFFAVALSGAYLLWRYWKPLAGLFIPAVAFVVAVYGYGTDCDYWMSMTMMLVALMLLADRLAAVSWKGAVIMDAARSLRWNRFLVWLCVVLSVSGIAQAVSRERVKECGLPYFFQYDGDKYKIKDGFFKGVTCGNIFAEIIREETIVVQQARTNTVWFGPIMEWGYAAYNLPSPPMQPLLWEPINLIAEKDEAMFFDRFMDSHFETLIFFKDDYRAYKEDQLRRIYAAYDIDENFHTLTVGHLKHR